MISLDALRTYAYFGGDADGLALAGTPAQRASVAGDVWARLDLLITEVCQLRAGLVAPEYAARIRRSLLTELPDEAARAEFFRIAQVDAIE